MTGGRNEYRINVVHEIELGKRRLGFWLLQVPTKHNVYYTMLGPGYIMDSRVDTAPSQRAVSTQLASTDHYNYNRDFRRDWQWPWEPIERREGERGE